MSVQTELARIIGAKDTIRDKLIEWGVTDENGESLNTAQLDTLAAVLDTIRGFSGTSKTLQIGDIVYTIPAGYHDGTGKVSVTLHTPTPVTPSAATQYVTAPEGKLIAEVTVKPIPENYKDSSNANVEAIDVLSGKIFVGKNGQGTGEMPNIGAQKNILTPSCKIATIEQGYHNGLGAVGVDFEEDMVFTPARERQIYKSDSKFIEQVTIEPIGDELQDVSGVTVPAEYVLSGFKFVTSSGVLTDGKMIIQGKVTRTMTGMDATNSVITIPKGYHDGTGIVSLDSTIEDALKAI